MLEGSLSSTPSLVFFNIICRLFNDGYSDCCDKREWNNAIYSTMDEFIDYHTKWSKPEREWQIYHITYTELGFPGYSACKESTCNVGYLGLIPGLGRSPGGGYGNHLQYSYLEDPMDRGAWGGGAIAHGGLK